MPERGNNHRPPSLLIPDYTLQVNMTTRNNPRTLGPPKIEKNVRTGGHTHTHTTARKPTQAPPGRCLCPQFVRQLARSSCVYGGATTSLLLDGRPRWRVPRTPAACLIVSGDAAYFLAAVEPVVGLQQHPEPQRSYNSARASIPGEYSNTKAAPDTANTKAGPGTATPRQPWCWVL